MKSNKHLLELYRQNRKEVEVLTDEKALFILGLIEHFDSPSLESLVSNLHLPPEGIREACISLQNAGLVSINQSDKSGPRLELLQQGESLLKRFFYKHTAHDSTDLHSLTVEELVIKLRHTAQEDASTYVSEIIARFEPLLRKAWRDAAFRTEYKDFVQEVVFRFFRGLPGLRSGRSFPGYLRKIAVGVAVDSLRKQSIDPIARAEPLSPEDKAELRRAAETIKSFDEEILKSIHVRYCLEMLRPEERTVIELGVIEGLSVKEIGDRLRINQATVRVMKFRALKKLQRILRAEGSKLEKESVGD